jgi:hypothetical protein
VLAAVFVAAGFYMLQPDEAAAITLFAATGERTGWRVGQQTE